MNNHYIPKTVDSTSKPFKPASLNLSPITPRNVMVIQKPPIHNIIKSFRSL